MSNASAVHILVEKAFDGGETQKSGNLCKMSVDKNILATTGVPKLRNTFTIHIFWCTTTQRLCPPAGRGINFFFYK